MDTLIILLIPLVLLALAIAGFVTGIAGKHLTTWSRSIYFLSVVAAIGIGAWSTYGYDYFPNPNTHFHGWPIPYVVFQRDNPESEWRDFVGPTTLLAMPLNWLVFLALPSLAILITNQIRKKK
jgi:hypothetical protein